MENATDERIDIDPDDNLVDLKEVSWFEFKLRLWNQVSYDALTSTLAYFGWNRYQVVVHDGYKKEVPMKNPPIKLRPRRTR
jgi:hypothetical protein